MRVAYIRRAIFSSRMGSAHRGAGTISFHLHVHMYANIHEENQAQSFPLSLSHSFSRSSLRFSDDRGQVVLRPCRADRMLPGFLRVQSGPRIRVVGCTGMHAVGWPGAFLRRCRVSHSPCPERVRSEMERKMREATAGRERRSEKGAEGGRSGNDETPGLSHGHERSSNESFCLFAEAIEFAREERTASLARPVPGYRPSPPLLVPDIPMPFLYRGIANFFLAAIAAAEEVNSLRLPRSAQDATRRPSETHV